jgi:hypothetical protein
VVEGSTSGPCLAVECECPFFELYTAFSLSAEGFTSPPLVSACSS